MTYAVTVHYDVEVDFIDGEKPEVKETPNLQ